MVRKTLGPLLDTGEPFAIERFGRTTPPSVWGLNRRIIGEHLVYYVLRGTLRVVMDGVDGMFPVGSLVCIPAGNVHTVRFAEPGEGTFYHLRFTCGTLALKPAAVTGYAPFRACLDDMFAESRRARPDMQRIRAYLYALLTGLREKGRAVPDEPGLPEPVRQRCAAYIAERLHESIDVNELARGAGYNPRYFTRLFKRSFGLPPRVYAARERIFASQEELRETDMTVGEVAAYYGFPDIYHYSKQFKKYCGVSPVAYRRRNL